MKHEYVGDIGDFANNGLLRYLCGVTGPKTGSPLRLGVVWYLNDSESDAPDGNRIDYLNVSDSNKSLYQKCDPGLHDALRKLVGESLVCGTKRSIKQIEKGGILPGNTVYFSDPLRKGDRSQWLKDSIQGTQDADLVFINPDTGIASTNQTNSLAHVTIDEIRELYEANNSLIIYQHSLRYSGWIENIARRLHDGIGSNYRRIWALQWRRVQGRVYFIIPRTEKQEFLLKVKIMALLNSPWGKKGHFTEAQIES